jgi:hypothetical protein
MHLDLLAVAQALSIDSNSYRDWLKMRSVTFSRDPNVAVTHALRFCGGQGLMNLQSVASVVIANGDVKRTILAKEIIAQIARFRDSQPVVYAVNLSGLGDRLVNEGAIYQFYIDPRKPLPEASEIGPRRLLARLNIHVK